LDSEVGNDLIRVMSYWKVLGKSKDIFKRIGTGNRAAVKSADQLVRNVGAVLQHEQATMTLMDIVSSTGMAEGLSSHALNVCIMSLIIGKEMGLDPDELHMLGLGALFHDIGKRMLPMKVNFHSTGITMMPDPESAKFHPEKGEELMATFKDFPLPSLETIIQHHERLDGSGFPKGISKEQISLFAQIVMVADEYDELCNPAETEKSLTPHEALSQLYLYIDSKKQKFSKEVILTLIQTMTVFPPGTLVELSDGTIGQVISVKLQNPTRPLLLSSHFAGTRQEDHGRPCGRNESQHYPKPPATRSAPKDSGIFESSPNQHFRPSSRQNSKCGINDAELTFPTRTKRRSETLNPRNSSWITKVRASSGACPRLD